MKSADSTETALRFNPNVVLDLLSVSEKPDALELSRTSSNAVGLTLGVDGNTLTYDYAYSTAFDVVSQPYDFRGSATH